MTTPTGRDSVDARLFGWIPTALTHRRVARDRGQRLAPPSAVRRRSASFWGEFRARTCDSFYSSATRAGASTVVPTGAALDASTPIIAMNTATNPRAAGSPSSLEIEPISGGPTRKPK
jgi:hypothetical protein